MQRLPMAAVTRFDAHCLWRRAVIGSSAGALQSPYRRLSASASATAASEPVTSSSYQSGDSSSSEPPTSPAATAVGTTREPSAFTYRSRWRYVPLMCSTGVTDYLYCTADHVISLSHTYKRDTDDTTVTLIPLRHFAHPIFFKQVDDLCCQHDSVLMEGRVPITGALHSTIVPPRQRVQRVRPEEEDDAEGWEPREVVRFFQPFSWGVKDSPNFTVVHAADKYDYEVLPWWCSVRFNVPVLGSLAREQHCLNMIPPLRANGYKSFAVPWGAAHMPIFHEALIDNGFECIGMASLVVVARVDGDISAGEHGKVRAWQRRRHLRQWLWPIGGLLMGLWVVRHNIVLEVTRGTPTRGSS